jgi:DNA-binding NtrC family response regulator
VVEGLLFGHRRGAFTGAVDSAVGLIEEADRGTLFLDELCSTSPEAQSKLLRVLETGQVRRVGETSKRQVDLRVVAAVQASFREKVADGTVRFDLVQRLAGAVITLPPLRDRDADVRLLAERFASENGAILGRGCELVLGGYDWPGNVRELRLAVARAASLTESTVLEPALLAESIHLGADSAVSQRRVGVSRDLPEGTVRDRLLMACAANEWQSDRIAKALGLGRTTLFKHLKSHGVSLRQERGAVDNRLPADSVV